MNIRQACFADLVASGMATARAYFEAGYSPKVKGAASRAARLLENDQVLTRIGEIRGEIPTFAIMPKIKKIRILEGIIVSDSTEDCVKIEAIRIHNLLVGDHAPTHIVVDAGPGLMSAIRGEAMTLEEALSVIARNARPQD